MAFPRVRWGTVLAGVAVAVIAVQFVPYGHNHTNPPVMMEPAWNSPETRALAKQACFDCHSNETRWPVYASVAPISWFVHHDVLEGRSALNFSEWHVPQKEAADASEAVSGGEMPLRMYQVMHAEARLSPADRDRLVNGLALTLGTSHNEAVR